MRYAIYYAPPPGSTLHRLGSAWLGRDAANDEPVKQPAIEGLSEVTKEPACYGFHATLKAPFALNSGMRRFELGDAVALMAAQMEAVTIQRLELLEIDGFLALVPSRQDNELSFLGKICVCGLDSFRAKPTNEELARRRTAKLTAQQEQHLRRWGYPYVLDEFRFHMTLTRKLENGERQVLKQAARRHFAPILDKPLTVDALTVFAESRSGQNFVVEERFPLRQSAIVRVAS
jgi:putative phosphonate metabolism protein